MTGTVTNQSVAAYINVIGAVLSLVRECRPAPPRWPYWSPLPRPLDGLTHSTGACWRSL